MLFDAAFLMYKKARCGQVTLNEELNNYGLKKDITTGISLLDIGKTFFKEKSGILEPARMNYSI